VGKESCVVREHELSDKDFLCFAGGFKLVHIEQVCSWPCLNLYTFVTQLCSTTGKYGEEDYIESFADKISFSKTFCILTWIQAKFARNLEKGISRVAAQKEKNQKEEKRDGTYLFNLT